MAQPLDPWPYRRLGSEVSRGGVGFALYAGHASKVTLVVVDGDKREQRHAMHPHHNGVWSGFLRGAEAGLLYGFYVDGPRERHLGHAHDPTVRLVDPRAHAFEGAFVETKALRGHGHHELRPWSVVVDEGHFGPRATHRPHLGAVPRPEIAWRDTVVYEAHVRGLTMRHPGIPRDIRGTYAALAHPVMLEHYRALGITTLELLPVFEWATEEHLVDKGLTNYWGYAPIGYFAASRHLARDPLRANEEFRDTVEQLHDAGFEVLLDVVFNHTGEGGEDAHGHGMAWHFRGIDRRAYYRTAKAHPHRLVDFSGCGNTLDLDHPRVIEFVLDSLRHWAGPMGVDGFRFDLAATLARSHGTFATPSKLLEAIRTDPLLGRVKLIAEPWDLGPDGYRLGHFGQPFREWNDRFRDAVRAFWIGDGSAVGDFATRIAGSADFFPSERGGATASINYVTAHDGFTLADLVSFDRKHNEANREGNRDGWDSNRSWNGGVEGPTHNGAVIAERRRRMKSMLATLLLSAGTPMLAHGDERARTQLGNNNAYCQDNALAWIDWEHISDGESDLVAWVAKLIELRMQHACFRPERPLRDHGPDRGDVAWHAASGERMSATDWEEKQAKLSWVLVEPNSNERGFVVLANGTREPAAFTLPETPHKSGVWTVVLDASSRFPSGYRLESRDAVVLTSGTAIIAEEK